MALEDFKKDIYRCNKCGGCLSGCETSMPSCPSGERFGFMSYYARADCKTCEDICTEQTSVRNLDIIMELKHEAVERGFVPPEIRDFLKNIDRYGNPYKEQAENREKWTEGTGVKKYSGEPYLFFVGCEGSYDDKGKKISRAFAGIMQKAGIPFGVLGKREISDGNEVNRVGDKWLFEKIAAKNIGLFKNVGAQQIVTISPHAYNAIKNEYPRFGGNFKVSHSTQLIRDLLREGKITLLKGTNEKITYHDPCWLGRRNEEYDAPREILRTVPGIQLVEMPRSRNYSYCCGGGGGNFISDILGGGKNAPARIRVREAAQTGADVLAVACPVCSMMFEDAVKLENLEDTLSIRDVSEIVFARIA